MTLFKLIHLLAVLIWVGGMFFAYVVLRPLEIPAQEPRLMLLDAVLRRFFKYVWIAAGALLVTGFYLTYLYGGIVHTGRHVHVMLALGLAMMLVYCHVFFACYVPYSLHVAKRRWSEAGEMLARMRGLVLLNLLLGLMTVSVAAIGINRV